MKKLFKIAGLVLGLAMLAACSNGSGSGNSSDETFSKTTVFNPNTTKVKLVAVSSTRAAEGDVVDEIEPLKSKEVELGSEHDYFFTDAEGNKIADLSKSDNGEYYPVYLELNEPKAGKDYLLLNQYRNPYILENFTRNGNNGNYETYQLFLYEIVDEDSLDAIEYYNEIDDKVDTYIYIRAYPSANCWIDSEAYASNMLGHAITYSDAFANQFTPLSEPWAAWGWSTRNEEYDMWFCHRVVSYVLHLNSTYSKPVITITPKLSSYHWWNAANISESEITLEKIKQSWNANWYYQLKSITTEPIDTTELFEEDIKEITKRYPNQIYYFLSTFTKNREYLVVAQNETIRGTYLVELTLRDNQ